MVGGLPLPSIFLQWNGWWSVCLYLVVNYEHISQSRALIRSKSKFYWETDAHEQAFSKPCCQIIEWQQPLPRSLQQTHCHLTYCVVCTSLKQCKECQEGSYAYTMNRCGIFDTLKGVGIISFHFLQDILHVQCKSPCIRILGE